MTDEEIEKALECCACLTKSGCTQCPLQSKSARYACTIDMSRNALDYIHRFKAENESLRQSDDSKEKCTIEQHAEIHRLRDELKQVRKDAAKEIFHDIHQTLAINYVDEEIGFQDECIDTTCLYEDLKEIAAKHGIEVDDE